MYLRQSSLGNQKEDQGILGFRRQSHAEKDQNAAEGAKRWVRGLEALLPTLDVDAGS